MTGGAFTPSALEFVATVGNRRLEKPFDTQTLLTVRVALCVFVIVQTLLSPAARVTLPWASQAPPKTGAR